MATAAARRRVARSEVIFDDEIDARVSGIAVRGTVPYLARSEVKSGHEPPSSTGDSIIRYTSASSSRRPAVSIAVARKAFDPSSKW